MILLMLLTVVGTAIFIKKGIQNYIRIADLALVEMCIRFLFLLMQIHCGDDTYMEGTQGELTHDSHGCPLMSIEHLV